MTARTPVYIDSGKLHVFEDGDTLPPWLSPSSMAWENLTGVPAGLSELAVLTGPGYAKVDSAGAWSVQAAIPQADVSGLTTTLAGLQPISARLTAIAGLTDAAGWLHDDGAGNWSLTTPTKSDVGLGSVENTALSTWAGSANLTTLGIISTGTWRGTAIADSYIASAATWNAKEGGLGNPSVSGQVLASTTAGARSWVSLPDASTTTPAALGTAAVGTGTTWARADHVHAMPTASQVGAEPALGSPSVSGYLLSSTSAGARSWVAPYSLPAATASVLGGVKVGTGLSISSGALSVSYGNAAGTACVGNDSRLSDSRTPTAHVLDGALHTISGKTAGQVLVATGATTFGFATISGDATLSGSGALTLASLLTAGSAGSSTSVPVLTWDAKGRLTAVKNATITTSAIGALPSMIQTGAVDFNSINSSIPGAYSIFGTTSYAHAPTGLTVNAGGGMLWQGYGANRGEWNAQVFVDAQQDALWYRTESTPATWRSWHQLMTTTSSIPSSRISDWGTYINQPLLTTSSPTFGQASLGTWTPSPNTAWFGAVGQNNNANGNSGFLQFVDGDKSVFMCAPAGGFANIQYGGLGYIIVGSSGVSVLSSSPGFSVAPASTFTGLITANGGISGNLTGHASLDIPLTGSSAITGALTSSNLSNLGSATLQWGSIYGSTIYEDGTSLSRKYQPLENQRLSTGNSPYFTSLGVASTNNTTQHLIGLNADGSISQRSISGEAFIVATPSVAAWKTLTYTMSNGSNVNITLGGTLSTGDLSVTGSVVGNLGIASGTFKPTVIDVSTATTISAVCQGKMLVVGSAATADAVVTFPATGPFAGFWFFLSFRATYSGNKYGPESGYWWLNGTSQSQQTNTPFSGIVSWTGNEWVCG